MTSTRGIALVLAILVTSFLTAIGLGLALIVMMDRLATGNLRGSVAMLGEAKVSFAACSWMALITFGCWCPTLVLTNCEAKSR